MVGKVLGGSVVAALIAIAVALAAGPAHGPRVMHFACQSKLGGYLRYVAKPSSCGGRHQTLVRFPGDYPVHACRLERGGYRMRARRVFPPAFKRAVAGQVRVVRRASDCAPSYQLNEQRETLPRLRQTRFCASKHDGTLRWVSKFSSCKRLEFRVLLRPRSRHQVVPIVPGNGGNRAPVANGDTGSTGEDSATGVNVLANDTDADGDTLHVSSLETSATKGNVTQNPDGTLGYDPNGKFEALNAGDVAHDTFSYRANDGHADSAPATVDVTVTGVNDPPALSGTESSNLPYVDGDPGRAISPALVVGDVDNDHLHGAVVRIASGYAQGSDELQFTNQNGISGTFDSGTGILTLTGSAPVADYQSALRSIRFASTGAPGGSRSIEFRVDDGSPASNLSNTATRQVNVGHSPTDLSLSNASVDENQPQGTAVGTLSTTDQDAGDTFTYSLVSGPGGTDNGQFQITGASLETAGPLNFENGASRSVRIRTTDANGGRFEKQLTITVNDLNDPPANLDLSSTSVDENQLPGATVGTLSATDEDGDALTYTLATGSGDTDNAQFQIVGDTLKTNASFDFETKPSYSIRVQAADGNGGTVDRQFTIDVNDVNDTPTDLSSSSTSVAENQPSGTTLGTLSTTDQDVGQSHTYSLANGPGDTDNGQFQISGSTLQTAAKFDFETTPSYSIRIKTDDGHGGSFEKALTINVTDANDAPSDVLLSNSKFIQDLAAGQTVGSLSSIDQDAGDSHTYSLVAGAGDDDNGSFTIDGDALKTAANLPNGSYSVRVQSDDGHGGTFEKQFTVTAVPPNADPTDISLSNSSVAENQPSGTAVGTLSTTDADVGDSHTYSLVTGNGDTDNASFQISGSTLETAAPLDFEAQSTYSVRIQTDDGHGGTFQKQFTISATDANDTPTDISLSSASVDENQPSGTTIGSFSSTDQDAGDTHTYSLVSGTGSTDNGSFTIDATGHLKSAAAFDFETKKSYAIRVRTTDSGSATFDKQFTITINDVNDAPVANADSYSGVVGNTKAQLSTTSSGPVITLSGSIPIANDTDQDTTFPHTLSTVAETVSSTNGGSATINSDGSFTFTPHPGDVNASDTFHYHVTDGSLTTQGTVTMNIANVRVWYIDNSLGSNGNGTSSSPFNTLSGVNAADGSGDSDASGDYLFLYGSGNYTGGLPLEANENLIGQANGLTVNNGSGAQTLVTATGGTASNNPTIQNSGGDAIQLANGSDVERVNAGTASGVGVKGSSVTSSTVGSTTTISGATGGALALSGAAGGNISIGSNITASAGHSVSIANRSSGTVALSGSVNDTGTGISLSSNTGANINFSGAITASTGSSNAFSATGGGTVAATASGSTLTTTSGTALKVDSTAIAAAGLTFQSISAGTSSGTAGNGIFLNGTGSAGGLTVTGTGTAGSGGTIQQKTGNDGATDGIGIYLNNTSSVSLTRMQLHDFDNFAIRGTTIGGFSLTNSTINGTNGTSAAADEASIALNDLTGTGTLTNDTISGGVEDDARIQNATGSLNSLSITGSTFATTSANTANDALSLIGEIGSSTFNASVTNNTFTRAQGDLFGYNLKTGTGTLDFSSNTVTNDFPSLPAGGGDINVSSGSTSASASQNLQYTISNNHIYSSGTGGTAPNGSVIVVAATPQGSATGTIANNLIGTSGVTQSGGFDAILVDAVKAGVHKVTITGNTIRRYKEAGIRILGVSPAASPGFDMRATVKGNTITEPDSVAFAGIDAEVGADPSDVGTMCVDLGGTTAADKNSVSNGDPNNFNDINLIQQFNTSMNLPGYSGSATDDAAVSSFVAGRNNGDGTPTVSAIHDTTAGDGNPAGSGFTGSGTGCG